MERIRTPDTAERLALGLALVPPLIVERLGRVCHFEGDPHFAGLFPSYSRAQWRKHHGDPLGLDRATRAIYSDQGWQHASHRCPTITFVSPPWVRAAVVLHEYGHAIHRLILHRGGYDAQPAFAACLTSHGNRSYHETIAEAFATWLLPPEAMHPWRDQRYRGAAERFYIEARGEDNRAVLALFNELAGWPADRRPRALA